MRRIITSALVATALIAGGAAFAEDSNSNQDMLLQSQVAFAAQSANRTAVAPVERGAVTGKPSAAAATVQGFAPVDTTASERGGN
jgi:hypothetical protein